MIFCAYLIPTPHSPPKWPIPSTSVPRIPPRKPHPLKKVQFCRLAMQSVVFHYLLLPHYVSFYPIHKRNHSVSSLSFWLTLLFMISSSSHRAVKCYILSFLIVEYIVYICHILLIQSFLGSWVVFRLKTTFKDCGLGDTFCFSSF